jgi:hypothetical protein
MFRLRPDCSDEDLRVLDREFRIMATRIDELKQISCGADAGIADPSFDNPDFIAIMDFDDEAAWRTYLAHPAHDEFAARYLLPIRAQTIGVQFFVGSENGPQPQGDRV